MKYRTLGRTGIEVSPYGLGTLMFASQMGNDPDESVKIMHKAIDAGINLIDTADRYADSEDIVGRALKGRRDEVVLATKVGLPMGEGPNQKGASRRWITKAVENSCAGSAPTTSTSTSSSGPTRTPTWRRPCPS